MNENEEYHRFIYHFVCEYVVLYICVKREDQNFQLRKLENYNNIQNYIK